MLCREDRRVQLEDRIINMVGYPFHLYDDATGTIETFYPSVWTFCERRYECNVESFPRTACYVFSPDMEADIHFFRKNGYNVAVVASRSIGRGGIEISMLVSPINDRLVIYRRNHLF